MDRIVMHIDMDAFFAAIEEREKPRLKGKPIVVGADPKDGEGRGVVATANYKAREYGIHSALPISTAWRLSEEAFEKGKPRAVFIGGHRNIYFRVSREIMDYLETQNEKIQRASIDEAYLDISELGNYKKAESFAKKIKSEILKKQKLTCSIGIGSNKLVSKIASDFKKPNGLTIVLPPDVQKFLDPMSVGVIPGIGPKARESLLKLNVKTIHDLRNIKKETLENKFGKWGIGMWNRARGIDTRDVMEKSETKSIGEQHTFLNDTLDSIILVNAIKKMSDSVFKSLKRKKFKFKTVSIMVRFSDFKTQTRARTLKNHTQDKKVLETEVLSLFLPFLDKRENPKKKLIRLLGIRVQQLK